MERVDLRKLDLAYEYVRRICNGKNPVNNHDLKKDSELNDPNVIRCMEFILDTLGTLRDNDGKIRTKVNKEIDLERFPFESLSEYVYGEDLSITYVVENINKIVGHNGNSIYYKKIVDWLKKKFYLEKAYIDNLNKETVMPTAKGREIGIYSILEKRESGRSYVKIMYDKNAQKFIISNLREILYDEYMGK